MKFTNLVRMIADQNFYVICFTFFYPTAPAMAYGRRLKFVIAKHSAKGENCACGPTLVSRINFFMGSNPSLAILFLFFSSRWRKKWALACPNFGECTARVKLELTDFMYIELWIFYKGKGRKFGRFNQRNCLQFAKGWKDSSGVFP